MEADYLNFKNYATESFDNFKVSWNLYQGTNSEFNEWAWVMVHCTGFSKEMWEPLIVETRKLGWQGDIVTLDLRMHGDSASKKILSLHGWRPFALDVISGIF